MQHEGRSGPSNEPLDETDRKIVAALRRDGRLSVSALADAVSISRANAYTRLNRLIESRVITGFTAQVDPAKLGHTTSAYVMLQLQQASWQNVRPRVAQIPEVHHVALVGGDFDVILLVRAHDTADLRRVVLHELQSIPEVRQTKTSLVFEDHDLNS